LSDQELDIVYICTTNNLHKENVLRALEAGKHVLCEKPMGISKMDVEHMINVAKMQGRFLLEGMWTRFLPAYKHFKQLLFEQAIGTINFLRVDFGFFSDWGLREG